MIKHHIPKTIITLAAIALLSSCISRLQRPELTGIITDEQHRPIAGCKVGETTTNPDGSFKLKEKRYNLFILTELFQMEAPPVMVYETIEKPGYQKTAIDYHQSHGGGQQKGAKMDLDTIILKKIK